ncbi:hypothetical protein PUN28_000353 [Cardiocondyla obscurior]|uniref:Uncharacterized protein n=1 Tax=Cardiocondyla obscurior TaxID=286306 RepID=A0AAW2GZ36_9HYME
MKGSNNLATFARDNSVHLSYNIVSLPSRPAVFLLRCAFSRPLLPHLPSPASGGSLPLDASTPVRIFSSRAMLARKENETLSPPKKKIPYCSRVLSAKLRMRSRACDTGKSDRFLRVRV